MFKSTTNNVSYPQRTGRRRRSFTSFTHLTFAYFSNQLWNILSLTLRWRISRFNKILPWQFLSISWTSLINIFVTLFVQLNNNNYEEMIRLLIEWISISTADWVSGKLSVEVREISIETSYKSLPCEQSLTRSQGDSVRWVHVMHVKTVV